VKDPTRVTRPKLNRGWWMLFGFVEMRTGLDDTNGDSNITSSGGLDLGWGFTIGVSKLKVEVAKALFPGSSLRLPWDAPSWRSFSSGYPMRRSNSPTFKYEPRETLEGVFGQD
jgi:hypothetical protein